MPVIPLASIRYFKISRSLIFDSMQSAKNVKIMHLENLTLYGAFKMVKYLNKQLIYRLGCIFNAAALQRFAR